MGYSAIPTINECFNCYDNLRIASVIVGFYCFFHNGIYYAMICNRYGCYLTNPILITFIRTASTLLLMFASVVLLSGLYYGNDRFVHFFVVAALWTFTLDVIGAFYYLHFVITNLKMCYELGYVNACAGLMVPLILFYCIAIVNSYWQEMKLPPFNKIEEMDKKNQQ